MSFHVFARHGALRRSINTARLRKSEIEFVWAQIEELIEHGKNKEAKTKLELMQRMHQLLAKTMPKNKQKKKRWELRGYSFLPQKIAGRRFPTSIGLLIFQLPRRRALRGNSFSAFPKTSSGMFMNVYGIPHGDPIDVPVSVIVLPTAEPVKDLGFASSTVTHQPF
jgi:hypothetical protein